MPNLGIDLTPLFAGVLILGLALILIGIAIRKVFPKSSTFGALFIVSGTLPALTGAILLIAVYTEKW